MKENTKIVHDTHNLKNILKLLAEQHQKMMAYYLSSPAFFKPEVQTTKLQSVLVATLPEDVQLFVSSITDSNAIYSADHVIIDGMLFRPGMFVCTGLHGELPDFHEIRHTLLVNDSVYFVLKRFESNYVEHLHSYELVAEERSL